MFFNIQYQYQYAYFSSLGVPVRYFKIGPDHAHGNMLLAYLHSYELA